MTQISSEVFIVCIFERFQCNLNGGVEIDTFNAPVFNFGKLEMVFFVDEHLLEKFNLITYLPIVFYT